MSEQKKMTDDEISAWIDGLKDLDVYEGSDEVAGLRVSVTQDDSPHSEDVSMTMVLLDYDIVLKREGRKEVSYGSWVDTNWYAWERD